ncbi:flagellar hook-basal body protein [Litchfieldia salsa]|uniref:Flagellar basal-body rod protein FlgG n=1 Tax=Litchfieldia salsa TaxID=930152 RepID=A0A1H0U2C2_9BACI|nr:flagellar hook-basal body protein [Litchfieldia salsa]SDP60145.1 flagellar basal-body rod protein FlgG [Litchfieldia salsa]
MLRGFYTAASGMFAQQRRTEMLTNNIANANTPGFKADQSSLKAFPEMLLQRMESNSAVPSKKFTTSTNIGSLTTGVYMQEATPQFSQGDIRETGRNADLALVNGNVPEGGSLFFTVENANGDVRYTRNGNFTLDGAGYLTTNEGYYVLNENGNRIQLENEQFSVASNGAILENGFEVNNIGITFSQNSNNLVKEGNGLFAATEDGEMVNANNNPDTTYAIRQGYIERSNVDVAASMTDMMTAYRAFEANQKILQAYDRSMEKAVNEIGRLR